MIDLSRPLAGQRMALPQVTLCAVTSVNVTATIRALEACLEQVAFAECKLLTHATLEPHPEIRVVPISRLGSSAAYSDFVLSQLVDHVKTSHCLIVQWDGHVLNACKWRAEFLDYDYIGASWPQFTDGHDVGNGGFSLRSRRLMEACRHREFCPLHPEDLAIGRANRDWLEAKGLRFAPRELADIFAAERAGDPAFSFGYHGVFNMTHALGVERFWDIYRDLDEPGNVYHDLGGILRDVARGPGAAGRLIRMTADRVQYALGKKDDRSR